MTAPAIPIDPVRRHLSGTDAGDDVLALADRLRVPLGLDLLRLPAPAARLEASLRLARHLIDGA